MNLVSFTQENAFKLIYIITLTVLYSFKQPNILCKYTSHFAYLFIHWWAFPLLPSFLLLWIVLLWAVLCSLWCIPRSTIASCTINQYSAYWEVSILFGLKTVPFNIPITKVWRLQFLYILTSINSFLFSHFSCNNCPSRYGMEGCCSFGFYFSTDQWYRDIFLYLLTIGMSYLETYLFKSFAIFKPSFAFYCESIWFLREHKIYCRLFWGYFGMWKFPQTYPYPYPLYLCDTSSRKKGVVWLN